MRRSWLLGLAAALVLTVASSAPGEELRVAGASLASDIWAPAEEMVWAPAEEMLEAASVPEATLPLATPLEQTLLGLTNADRARSGLAPVEFDPSLLEIARTRASAQLTLPELSHYDVQGGLAFVGLLANARVEYMLAGENLARATGTNATLAERIEQAWMRSPTHRKNILEASFNRLAVGAALDESGRAAFAQIFRAAP